MFKQQRGGKHGRPFTMYKFRTMGLDAEDRRDELEEANEMTGPVVKVEKDPRVFKFGAFLQYVGFALGVFGLAMPAWFFPTLHDSGAMGLWQYCNGICRELEVEKGKLQN